MKKYLLIHLLFLFPIVLYASDKDSNASILINKDVQFKSLNSNHIIDADEINVTHNPLPEKLYSTDIISFE